jgi:hypothetical protein
MFIGVHERFGFYKLDLKALFIIFVLSFRSSICHSDRSGGISEILRQAQDDILIVIPVEVN